MRKDSLQRELERFFASLPTPRDICRFLVYKDNSGKTQVQKNGCIYLGKKGSFKCGCPLRLSYNTVDSYIGKLRAIFHAVGRRGEWDLRLGLGNPTADSSVKDYLRLVTTEQLQALVTPRQATPLFWGQISVFNLGRPLHYSILSSYGTKLTLKVSFSVGIGQGIWVKFKFQKFKGFRMTMGFCLTMCRERP